MDIVPFSSPFCRYLSWEIFQIFVSPKPSKSINTFLIEIPAINNEHIPAWVFPVHGQFPKKKTLEIGSIPCRLFLMWMIIFDELSLSMASVVNCTRAHCMPVVKSLMLHTEILTHVSNFPTFAQNFCNGNHKKAFWGCKDMSYDRWQSEVERRKRKTVRYFCNG